MFVVMCNDSPEAVAFTAGGASSALKQLKAAHVKQWELEKRSEYELVFNWRVLTGIPLVCSLGVTTPEIPTTDAALLRYRREGMGGFETKVEGNPDFDYAAGLQRIAQFTSHATESIPNGQIMRTRGAVESLLAGVAILVAWLDNRGVFKEEVKNGDQG